MLEHVSPLLVQRQLTCLREHLRPVSVHQHYRCLRAFFAWCVGASLLADNPMHGMTMRMPKVLPRVPEDEAVRPLLAACPPSRPSRFTDGGC